MNKYWRKSSLSQIKPEEKTAIRSRLFVSTNEPDKQINLQNALSIARIARIDFPTEWPSMFDDISKLVKEASESQNMVRLGNLLFILNQLVKSFSLTRFGAARNGFINAAPGVIHLVGEVYVSATEAWVSQPSENLDNFLAVMEVGYISLKVIGKVLANGYTYVHRAPEACQIFDKMKSHFQGFIMVYTNYQNDMIAKHIKTMGKIFIRILERFPVSFILLPSSLDVISIYMNVMQTNASLIQNIGLDFDNIHGGAQSLGIHIANPNTNLEEISEFWERIVVQGMLLFKSCITEFFKKGVATVRFKKEDDKADGKKAIDILQNQLFNQQNVQGMINLLLNHYLKLTPRDLESWRDEPEEWINEERQRSSEYQARPCSEYVLVSLLINFTSYVTPLLVSFIQEKSSSEDVLLKDVAYNVFRLANSCPFENVNFDEMLNSVFLPQGYSNESCKASANSAIIGNPNKLIRRRVCMIISEWISQGCSNESRMKIYEYLLFCLNPEDASNDKVIMLYACEALRCTVDDWDSDISHLLPFLEKFLERLFPFLNSVLQTLEAKKIVLDAINVIISRAKHHIAPYTNYILNALPALWEESEDNLVFRGAVLSTLTDLIDSSGENSIFCYNIAVPMLKVSIDPESPLSAALFEDALPLWQSMIKNAPEPNDQILSLLPGLITILKTRTENLPMELELLESYILLSPNSVAAVATQLFQIYLEYIPNIKSDEMTPLINTVSLLITLAPFEVIDKAMYESGLIKLLLCVLAADISPIINVSILTAFARMALKNADTFIGMLDATPIPDVKDVDELHSRTSMHGGPGGESCIYGKNNVPGVDIDHGRLPNSSLDFVLSQWCSKFDNMGQPRDRKICVLGSATIVSTGNGEVVSYLPDLFLLWQQLMEEAEETDIGDAEIYYVVSDYTNFDENLARSSTGRLIEPETETLRQQLIQEEKERSPEDHRKRKVWEIDPAHTIPVKPFLKKCVTEFQQKSSQHSSALSNVDAGVLETLSIALGM